MPPTINFNKKHTSFKSSIFSHKIIGHTNYVQLWPIMANYGQLIIHGQVQIAEDGPYIWIEIVSNKLSNSFLHFTE